MSNHDYTAEQALELLLCKLDTANADLAAQVRAAIDAGKDIEEEEPRRSPRKKVRRYRKAVRLSTQEALAAAADVLQAYFIEQPLFVASAMDSALSCELAGPRDPYEVMDTRQVTRAPDAGLDFEKVFDIELRAETQLTQSGDETYRLRRPEPSGLVKQRENMSHLRGLLRFGSE